MGVAVGVAVGVVVGVVVGVAVGVVVGVAVEGVDTLLCPDQLGKCRTPRYWSGGSGRNRPRSSRRCSDCRHRRFGPRRTRCGVRPATSLGNRRTRSYWSGGFLRRNRPRSSRRSPGSRHGSRRTRCGVRPATSWDRGRTRSYWSGASGRNRPRSSRRSPSSRHGTTRKRCGIAPGELRSARVSAPGPVLSHCMWRDSVLPRPHQGLRADWQAYIP